MYRIIKKQVLNPTVVMMDVEAPLVARKAQAGQFIILRVDEEGERIPLTVAGFDREAGTVKIIFQLVGATTDALGRLEEGDCIHDFVGPLGKATETDGLRMDFADKYGFDGVFFFRIVKMPHASASATHIFD